MRRFFSSPVVLGLFASMFFSSAFLLNRSMDLGGGFWIWSAVLRYVFMVPMLAVLVPWFGGWRPVFEEIRRAPWRWWLWSTVGFGLFYAPLCWAASFGESWLVAGLWQVTIVAGTLLFLPKGRIPWKTLGFSVLILLGVGLLQGGHALKTNGPSAVAVSLLALVAATAYPWGNRKVMALAQGRLTTVQRVAGMTILSLPFWFGLSAVALALGKPPTAAQGIQSMLVALFSGIVATLLFFRATDLVRGDPIRLGAVEATQAGEVVFSLLGEAMFLGGAWPDPWSALGLVLVVAGMTVHSIHGRARR
jgi:drug/metabolite transporter (DMT)-like permease